MGKEWNRNFLNVAKYRLDKVKPEWSWPAVSAFAVLDLRNFFTDIYLSTCTGA